MRLESFWWALRFYSVYSNFVKSDSKKTMLFAVNQLEIKLDKNPEIIFFSCLAATLNELVLRILKSFLCLVELNPRLPFRIQN